MATPPTASREPDPLVNIVFFGSGPFALPALELLGQGPLGHKLVCVVSRPDRPQRRGRQVIPMPARAKALELGLPCEAPETANDSAFLGSLSKLSPDIFIVADYGEMLRKPLRELPRIGIFNLHGSLLPRWRGAAPVVHSILNGDRESGVTLFRIEKGLDSGPIIDAARAQIGERETAGELEARLARLAADLLERNLVAFDEGTFRESSQDDSLATLAPKIEKSHGGIPWDKPALEVVNRIRAFNPWPGAFSFLDSERTILLRATLAEGAESSSGAPGVIVSVRKDGFRVRCGQGSIEVLQLQREGKAPLDAAAYLRGKALKPGDRFSSTFPPLSAPLPHSGAP